MHDLVVTVKNDFELRNGSIFDLSEVMAQIDHLITPFLTLGWSLGYVHVLNDILVHFYLFFLCRE